MQLTGKNIFLILAVLCCMSCAVFLVSSDAACVYSSLLSGSWHLGRMHGEGVYSDADKVSVSGLFFNGMYNSGKSYVSVRPTKHFN